MYKNRDQTIFQNKIQRRIKKNSLMRAEATSRNKTNMTMKSVINNVNLISKDNN